MGSAASLRRKSTIEFDEKRLENLELFTLIYLHDEFNEEIREKLRLTIDYLCYFNDFDQCEQFIAKRNSSEKLFVVVSSLFAQKFISTNHNVKQINFIYIFERNSDVRTNFSIEKYPKVNEILILRSNFSIV